MSDHTPLTEREKELLPRLTEQYIRRLHKMRDEIEDKPFDEITKKEKVVLKNIDRFTYIYNISKAKDYISRIEKDKETPKPTKKQKLTLEEVRSLMKKNVARLDPYDELFKAVETLSSV